MRWGGRRAQEGRVNFCCSSDLLRKDEKEPSVSEGSGCEFHRSSGYWFIRIHYLCRVVLVYYPPNLTRHSCREQYAFSPKGPHKSSGLEW